MDYSKFGIEDFLFDVSFQQYCLGNNDASVIFWTDWLKTHPEKAMAVKSAKVLYYTLNGQITDEHFRQDYEVFRKAFSNVLAADAKSTNITGLPPAKDKSSFRFILSVSAVAACLLIVCGLLWREIKYAQPTKSADLVYVSAPGKKISLQLADGSKVTLNGGSTLKVLGGFNQGHRGVTLEGEGYFEVVHDNKTPFTVHTAKINVRDIGTVFNVKAYRTDKTTEASLIRGAIEITLNGKAAAGKKPVLLSPNKKYVLLNNPVIKPVIDNQHSHAEVTLAAEPFKIKSLTTMNSDNSSVVETDWTAGRLSFYDQPLQDIATQMERWYGVTIHIGQAAADKNYRFTASFDHEDIIQVLQSLKLSGNFRYRKEGNIITIY